MYIQSQSPEIMMEAPKARICKTGVAFLPILCYFSFMKNCQYQTNTPVVSSFYAPFGFYLYEKKGCYHRMAVSKNMV